MATSAGRFAAVFGVALSLHILPTAIATAEPIRVLLVMPRETGELSRAVARIEDAMKGPDGPLVVAKSLADADAVVQFIRYQRKVGEKEVRILSKAVGHESRPPRVETT